jgi:hypothetical protein
VKKLHQEKTFYVVTDGNGKYAHGDTIQEAKSDLKFKIADRDTTRFQSLTTSSTLKLEDMIECYRLITGACALGVKDFIQRKVAKPKKKYTIKEIIELTNNEYGHDKFKTFNWMK